MDPYQGQQAEIYKLVRENNKMLHAMRRNAFWGGLFKVVIYGFFLLAPLWFYYQYLSPVVNEALKTVNQIQGTGAKAQEQLGGFQELLKQLEAKIPSFMRPGASAE